MGPTPSARPARGSATPHRIRETSTTMTATSSLFTDPTSEVATPVPSSNPNEHPQHHYEHLIRIFNDLFVDTFATELMRGDEEPIYLPADEHRPLAQVVFAHGYFASALHEIAHWCVAGRARRRLEDFGYWYQPDGRTLEQQRAFEKVEVKPQALEWIFSVSCGFRFHFSADNLSGENTDMKDFKKAVWRQVHTYWDRGLPKRARLLSRACRAFYGTDSQFGPTAFPEPLTAVP